MRRMWHDWDGADVDIAKDDSDGGGLFESQPSGPPPTGCTTCGAATGTATGAASAGGAALLRPLLWCFAALRAGAGAAASVDPSNAPSAGDGPGCCDSKRPPPSESSLAMSTSAPSQSFHMRLMRARQRSTSHAPLLLLRLRSNLRTLVIWSEGIKCVGHVVYLNRPLKASAPFLMVSL